jgi:hypothetical protein
MCVLVVMSHIASQEYSKFMLPLIQQVVNEFCNKNVWSFTNDSFDKMQRTLVGYKQGI